MSSANFNPYQAPQAVLTPQIVPGGDVWQYRGLLVIRKGAVLPDRCVKCNAPAEGNRLTRNLSWHNPLIYLTILAGILIYVIIAIIVQQKARVDIGLCAHHKSRRKLGIAIAWGLFLGGLLALYLSAAIKPFQPAVMWTGWVMVLASPFYGLFASRTVWAKKIDPYFAWIKGVSPDYLAELPASPVEFR